MSNFLKEKCEYALHIVETRLKYQYNAVEYIPSEENTSALIDKDRWRKQFLINTKIANQNVELIIAIPRTFPYKFPNVYLSKENKEYKNLPHIDDNLAICTFDPIEAQPNPDKPVDVALRTIQKAINIIEDGIQGRNNNDYIEEFLAYWNLNLSHEIISILEPKDQVSEICLINLNSLTKKHKSNMNIFTFLAASSFSKAINWLNNLGIPITKDAIADNVTRGLFLPIENIGNPPYPHNNKELIERLYKNSPESLKQLYKFLNTNKRPSTIVFGIKNSNDSWMLGAWQHPSYKNTVNKGNKSFAVSHQKGFRVGKQLSCIELNGFAKDLIITKYRVNRFDKERLFIRGGEGLITNQEFRINIIGCGSLGSFLANNLAKIGFNNFNLIDKELLAVENLARHFCEIEYISINKAEALKLAVDPKNWTGN